MPSKNAMLLGRVLTEMNLISDTMLKRALDKQKQLRGEGKEIALGELLVRADKISEAELAAALEEQKRRTVDVLKSRSEVEEVFGRLTVQRLSGITKEPFVDDRYRSHVQVAETEDGRPLILVTPQFQKESGQAFMTIRQRVVQAYRGDEGRQVVPKIVRVTGDLLNVYVSNDGASDVSGPRTQQESEFEGLIKEAYRAKAQDVHFFRKDDECSVRFRVFGDLRTHAEWNPENADKIINVGFQSFGRGSNYPTWDKNERQRVRIKIRYDQHVTLDCRYEHAPGDEGNYHTCIRILDNDKRTIHQLIDLAERGMTQRQADALETAISEPNGMVLVAGPTGSGKSTTLAALIKWYNRKDDKVVLTVESPIERELPAFQTSVSEDDDAGPNEFALGIKSMLRRNPDLAMVGEIRDAMSAGAAASGVQTGHTLISTIHAQSGIEIVERLASPTLNIPPSTIGAPSFINALVYQELLPRLDEESKVRLSRANIREYFTERELARFKALFPNWETQGICVRGSRPEFPGGVDGMTVCAEVIIPDEPMRLYFRKMQITEALKYWREKGEAEKSTGKLDDRMTGMTAAEHAIAKVELGLIDPRDLEEYFGRLDRIAEKHGFADDVKRKVA